MQKNPKRKINSVFLRLLLESAKRTAATLSQMISVIDLSDDLRLKDQDSYQKWYHQTAPTELLSTSDLFAAWVCNDSGNLIANPRLLCDYCHFCWLRRWFSKNYSAVRWFLIASRACRYCMVEIDRRSHFATAADNMRRCIKPPSASAYSWDHAAIVSAMGSVNTARPIFLPAYCLACQRGDLCGLYAPIEDAEFRKRTSMSSA